MDLDDKDIHRHEKKYIKQTKKLLEIKLSPKEKHLDRLPRKVLVATWTNGPDNKKNSWRLIPETT